MSQYNQSLIFIGDLQPYLDGLEGGYRIRFHRLKEECQRYFSVELPTEHPPKSITYMGITIVNLALCYLLTQEERYLTEARRWMNTVLGYEKWGNAHLVNLDLSASWLLWGLSLGYDWLQPHLPQEEAQAIQDKIAHHVKIMYDYMMENRRGWPVNYGQNHNWINLNGVATAGYVLQKHAGLGDHYIKEAEDNFAKVFELMPDDGSNYEGVTYWRYGGMWLFIYAHLAKTHSDVDLFQSCDYLKNTFYYRLYQSAGDMATQIDFGDCHDRYSCHTALVYYKTAAEYNDGYAQTFGDLVTTEYLENEGKLSKVTPGILPEAALELLFYSPAVAPKPLDELPHQRKFDDLGMVSLRSGFQPNDRVFSMKCGYPGGANQWLAYANNTYPGLSLSLSHHHPDNLSYVLCQGGDYFTREDGYNRNIMPTHHSVLLVDGQYTQVENANDTYVSAMRKQLEEDPQLDLTEAFRGTCSQIEEMDGLITFAGETHKVYPPACQMKQVSRRYITNADLDFFVFVDGFDSHLPHVYSAICNTEHAMVDCGNGTKSMSMGEHQALYAVLSDQPVVEDDFVQHIEAVMTTQEPDKKCIVDIYTHRTQGAAPCTRQTIVECIGLTNRCTVAVSDDHIAIQTAKASYRVYLADQAPAQAGEKRGTAVVGLDNNKWIWVD